MLLLLLKHDPTERVQDLRSSARLDDFVVIVGELHHNGSGRTLVVVIVAVVDDLESIPAEPFHSNLQLRQLQIFSRQT